MSLVVAKYARARLCVCPRAREAGEQEKAVNKHLANVDINSVIKQKEYDILWTFNVFAKQQ